MNTLDSNAGVADPLDQAAAVQQMEIDNALANHKPMYSGVSLEFCEECDAEIPERRRLALPGVNICVDCAGRKERKNGR